jgi:hypothetical protein
MFSGVSADASTDETHVDEQRLLASPVSAL